jgi:hypothetical protein
MKTTYLTKKLLTLAGAGLFSLALMPQADAIQITGTLGFSGGVSPRDGSNVPVDDLTLATQLVFTTPGVVLDPTLATGNFTGTTSVVFSATPLSFAPSNTPITPFYTTIPTGFSFQLLGISEVSASNTAIFLDLVGFGIFSGAGFDPTQGTFSISVNSATGNVSGTFAASSTTNVPDGGSAVALLGIALMGVEGMRRKLMIA